MTYGAGISLATEALSPARRASHDRMEREPRDDPRHDPSLHRRRDRAASGRARAWRSATVSDLEEDDADVRPRRGGTAAVPAPDRGGEGGQEEGEARRRRRARPSHAIHPHHRAL